jgi:hypothetical protein
MWAKNEITQKWPAARLIGPDVTKEQAREYIWRTDYSFINPVFAGNDHVYRQKLIEWIGENGSHQIDLEYFYSDWVACSYVGGPHGVIHPTGKVCLTKNFGKWPSIGAIEAELNVVANTFPWLEFDLGIWDGPDESDTDTSIPPDFAWKLKGGVWRRVSPINIFVDMPCPQHPPFNFNFANRRERYWNFKELVKTFDHFKQAKP